jgi:hypothetical protein
VAAVEDEAQVVCPWCHQAQLLVVDPGTRGQLVQDCDVCCRPWQVHVDRDEEGRLLVHVERA